MARLSVFVSSTFYDLRQIRQDVGSFIRNLGHQEVMHEQGDIAYGPDGELAEYCYEEVEGCDVLVAILGGRYGSASSEDRYSVTHRELLRAHELGKQIYVFVDRSVYAEFHTYRENRELSAFRPRHADDPRVYQFLEEFFALRKNNACFPFETAADIADILRAQLSGLLHRLLREKNLPAVASETTPHPAWSHLAALLNLPYPVSFRTEHELTQQLSYYGFQDDRIPWENRIEWSRSHQGTQTVLRAASPLFSGPLATILPQEQWSPALLTVESYEIETPKKT